MKLRKAAMAPIRPESWLWLWADREVRKMQVLLLIQGVCSEDRQALMKTHRRHGVNFACYEAQSVAP